MVCYEGISTTQITDNEESLTQPRLPPFNWQFFACLRSVCKKKKSSTNPTVCSALHVTGISQTHSQKQVERELKSYKNSCIF